MILDGHGHGGGSGGVCVWTLLVSELLPRGCCDRLFGIGACAAECRLRRSIVEWSGAATSPTIWCAAPSGSRRPQVSWTLFAGAMCGCSYASGGDDSCMRRRGRSMVPTFAIQSPSPAPLRPIWLTSYGLDRCFDATIADWTENFDRALRFDLNAPSELAHISLTALARVA